MIRGALRVRPRANVASRVRSLHNLRIGVPKESLAGEKRVALVPADVEKLVKKGAAVQVAQGAGLESGYTDAAYEASGATLVEAESVWANDLMLKVRPPTSAEAAKVENRAITSIVQPMVNTEVVDQLAGQGATVMAMDQLLRTLSRGQAFDVLSSQANVAGYRAVIEAGYSSQRKFAGEMTAAGRVNPQRVMVVGCGVAGLAAIQAAKALGAVVTAFDVRAAAAEQAEAMGATFLHVETAESGDGAGGYAKEMSAEWFQAAEDMLMSEMPKTNVIITTALIPGRPAPKLITSEHVSAMPYGGVTVDLAAEAGGNVATTVPGQVVTLPGNGVTCVGYDNMPSRMASVASQLFSGNVSKLVLSMDKDEQYVVDHENDEAVRSMLCVHKGTKFAPYVPPPPPPPTEAQLAAAAKAAEPEEEFDLQKATLNQALWGTGLLAGGTGIGSKVPDPGMLATFALSVWVGSQAVRGVAHSLHSPLMSITNAISGMTIVGGMLQLGGGVVPTTGPQLMATTAVGLSAVNLVGGFLITKKMLDMFRRPDDPTEYFHYYLAPPAAAVAGYGALAATGAASPAMGSTLALGSGLLCVGAIGQMATQQTSRSAIYLGLGGVGMGLGATLGAMDCSAPVYAQLLGTAALGGAAGHYIASRVGPTQLPQAVAGFHSMVGVAAASTAIGDYMVHDFAAMDGFHAGSIYMGAWMGGITTTGSIIAAGKLAELWQVSSLFDSKPLQLPGRDAMNVAMLGTSALGMAGFMGASNPSTATAALAAGTVSSGLLGFHMTASIGGADMPVVITLLNSYSGWALCAEGFILDQPVLTVVGALIGSSGAFLTKIMCDGMNRSLTNVILGGFGTESGAVQTTEGLVHTEINVEGSVAALLDADSVTIVPGYGLAVAGAAPAVSEIAMKLRGMGKTVKFAVHPVAGRMPGQLNVLLAEAGVPYDMVEDLEEINETLPQTDVVMVVGANDTVNSAAETDPNSAIAGMPVIQVWNSKHILFMKRSMASGYAGVDNPVFYHESTDMLLGDAKDTNEGILAGINAAAK